jgi:hypothetical protein
MEELRVYWVTLGWRSGSHARVLRPGVGLSGADGRTPEVLLGRPLRSKVDNSGKLGLVEPEPLLLEDERIFDAFVRRTENRDTDRLLEVFPGRAF